MRQKAPFTCCRMPSGVTTAMPIEVRSKASLRRSKSTRVDSQATALMAASAHLHRRPRPRRGRGARECFPEDDAEALRESFERVLLDREVDQLLRLEHFSRHVLGAAEGVREPQLH